MDSGAPAANRQAVEVVFTEHGAALMQLATVLVGPSDADDVVSAALVRLLRSPGFPRARNPAGYAYRAVVNEARRLGSNRSRRQDREALLAPIEAEFPTTSDQAIVAAVAGLPVRQRAVVFCAYWLDYSRDQIAELLGISPGTVAAHLQRARVTLAAVLEAEEAEGV